MLRIRRKQQYKVTVIGIAVREARCDGQGTVLCDRLCSRSLFRTAVLIVDSILIVVSVLIVVSILIC